MRVASFDVFDTVLVRAVGRPETVFLLVGRRLARDGVITCAPEAFARSRTAADRHAYAKSGRDGQVSHEAIFAELAALLGLDRDACRSAVKVELELEAELLRVSPVGQRLVAEARARGEVVAYLSDTYLPSSFLRAQLERHGLWQDGDRLYTSSEHPASKRSGRLYGAPARDHAVPFGAIAHHGNDPQTDLAGARRAGVRARLVADGNLNRYERVVSGSQGSTDGLGPALAGAARLARLRIAARSQREEAIRDVATGVGAPVLIAYVLWLISRCRRLGIRRLHFLSRDGQVLLEIARALDARLGLGLDLRHLYASRQAWNIATLSGVAPADLSWVFTHSAGASARGLLERVGLAPADLGLDPTEAARPLDAAKQTALLERLAQPPLHDLVTDRAAERAALLRAYLAQEGLMDGVTSAVVDVVARGSQHRTLCSMLARPPLAFYMGRQRHPGPTSEVPAETYLFDEQMGVGLPPFPAAMRCCSPSRPPITARCWATSSTRGESSRCSRSGATNPRWRGGWPATGARSSRSSTSLCWTPATSTPTSEPRSSPCSSASGRVLHAPKRWRGEGSPSSTARVTRPAGTSSGRRTGGVSC